MEPSLFRAFRDLAFEQAGIRLADCKQPLVAARVGKRVRALGLDGPRRYLEVLREDETGEELVKFLDVISTNFTSFFREPDHFDRLRAACQEWHGAGQRRFRFWSAACSSGEEPLSLALVLSELFGASEVDYRILATDLSTRVLAKANEAIYEERQLEPVSKTLRRRYFEPTGDGSWRAGPALRSRVALARLNLAQPPFPMKGPFDVVFCRNVMIYLAQPVRQALIAEIERLLRPGGLLMIGHAETLTGIHNGLRPVVPSVYRKP